MKAEGSRQGDASRPRRERQQLIDRLAKLDTERQKVAERFNELEVAERVLARFGEGEPTERRGRSPSPQRSEAEVAEAFNSAAVELLHTLDATLLMMRQGREEARAILDRLEAQLARHS
jgi:hypothetical protein